MYICILCMQFCIVQMVWFGVAVSINADEIMIAGNDTFNELTC